MSRRERALFIALWIAACVATVYPLFSARLLPILDLPNHLALVRGWLSFSDPSYHLAQHYTLQVRLVPYILFYAVCRALAGVMDIELAAKVSLALYIVAFVHGILATAIAARRTPWLAFAAFPLAYGPAYTFGFVNYLYGHALLWFAIAAALRYLEDRRAAWLVGIAVATLGTLASHVLAWGYLGLGLIALCIYELRARRAWRDALAIGVATTPSLAFFVYAYLAERRDRAYFQATGKASIFYRPLHDLIRDLPRWILECVPGDLDRAVLALLLVGVIAAFVFADPRDSDTDRTPMVRLRAIALGWIVGYALLPESTYAPTRIMFISHRLPVLAAAALLLAAPRPRPDRRWVLAPIVIAAFVLPPRLVALYRDFSARNRDFISLVEKIPRGAATLVVLRHRLGTNPGLLTPDDPSASVPVYWHFTSWPMVIAGGYSPHLFNQGIPIRPRSFFNAPSESKQRPFDLRYAPEYDYFLIHQPGDAITLPVEVVAKDGEWILYRRVRP